VKRDVWVASISGGTDVCSPLVGGCPILPVHSGEIQCRWLGAKVVSFDEAGRSVTGEMGELVVTEPMPSMPLFFWGDTADGERYRESYFVMFPGVWRHGDWIRITEGGSCVVYGRSDATIKRMGVRIGTSEIYRLVESIPDVADSLAVDLEGPRGGGRLFLFVVPAKGKTFDEGLAKLIRQKIKKDISPRYVPDEVLGVPAIPKTLSGKKLEVPIKKILMGSDPSKVVNVSSLSNPDSLNSFVELSKRLSAVRADRGEG
jgi:acetoacetyl-CoA synthetase